MIVILCTSWLRGSGVHGGRKNGGLNKGLFSPTYLIDLLPCCERRMTLPGTFPLIIFFFCFFFFYPGSQRHTHMAPTWLDYEMRHSLPPKSLGHEFMAVRNVLVTAKCLWCGGILQKLEVYSTT